MTDRGRHNGRGNADTVLVAALAAGSTVQDAAKTAGVAERTVYRRLDDPAFCKLVADARAEMLAQTTARLTSGALEAVDTLRALLSSEMDFARLAAARALLELGAKYREQHDLAERVRVLEERLTKGESWTPRAV